MLHTSQNKVRMHDTDMAGRLYFPRQFRFVHDAWEDLLEDEGMTFDEIYNRNEYAFVIVHAEADYLARLQVGDQLEVHIQTERIGTTSFTMSYKIYKKEGNILVGTAKTAHVVLDKNSNQKIPIPEDLRVILTKYS